jgi:hypothetical protein
MQKFFLCPVVVCLLVVSASAQERTPAVEIFGGYSYLNFDLAVDPFFVLDRQHGQGIGLSLAGNFTKHFGVVGDFSFNARDVKLTFLGGFTDRAEARRLYYLIGPQFSARGERLTGFGHMLIGAVRSRDEIGGDTKRTGFVLGAGGGLDVHLNKRVAIRAFQLDYLPSRIKGDFDLKTVWLQNFRAQAGVVIKLGGN